MKTYVEQVDDLEADDGDMVVTDNVKNRVVRFQFQYVESMNLDDEVSKYSTPEDKVPTMISSHENPEGGFSGAAK